MRIWYFSSKQRLHLFEDPLYGVALSMMRHDKSYSSLFPFRCQMCLLSSVAFFKLLFLNDCLCPYSLLLKVPSVSPTYFFILFSDLMVASYMTPWSKQRPSTGQVSFFLQLHDRRLLWLLTVQSIFGSSCKTLSRYFCWISYGADGQVESAYRPIGGISWRGLFPRSGSMVTLLAVWIYIWHSWFEF